MNFRKFLLIAGLLGLLLMVIGDWRWLKSEPAPWERPSRSRPPAPSAGLREAPSPAPPIVRAPIDPAAPRPAGAPPDFRERVAPVPASSNFASAWKSEPQAAIAAFNDWTARWLAAPAAAQAALLAGGVARAQSRREAVAELIRRDPRQAIASAVPMTVRAQLPPEILALLEERVSGVGELALNAVTPAPGVPVAEPVFRTASIGGQTYRAYVYGRREAQATRPKVSLLGVALDGALAVSESPLRVLEPGETPAPGVPVRAADPLPGAHAGADSAALTAVEAAGAIVRLCCTGHIADYEARLIRAEDDAGPFEGFSLNDSGSGTSNISGRPPIAWSQGTKKVLLIRVDFSDKTGTPVLPYDGVTIDDLLAVGLINNPAGVRDFYAEGSYQKTTLSIAAAAGGDSPDVTPVLRMPQTAAYYAVGNASGPYDQQLHDAARAAAAGAPLNLNLATYDRIGVVFSNLSSGAANTNPIAGSRLNYGGRANVQGKNFWINGFYNFGTVVHEIGHTYGLLHANLWQVTDGNPVSPGGSSLDYGDPVDPMGTNPVTVAHHFNHWEKSLLQWIPDTAVTTAGTSGTYRIHRFDHPSANLANPLAVKIVRNGTQDYWLGYRRGLGTAEGNGALLRGASILWGYNTVRQSDLLDFNTPGTNPGDAPLIVGQSFFDTTAGFTITPWARGGTAPHEYLDVRVNFGPFGGNVAPVVSIDGPANPAPRRSCFFTAQATDADGDPLAYSWDFGSGPLLENHPSAVFAWPNGGTYTVKVTVSDMKGHSVQASKVVTIADPLGTWTNRASISTGGLYALAANSDKVIAVGEDFSTFRGPVAVSADGVAWTRQDLPLNCHAYAALWDGARFVAAGANFASANYGTVFTSPDAVTWTPRDAGTPERLHSIAYGGGKYVVVSENGAIRHSTDCITWSSAVSGTTVELASVAYGGGKFVAIGHNLNASGNGTVLTSPDGVTWTNTSAGAGIDTSWQNFYAVFWGGGRFLASGWYSKLRHSLDLGATFQTTRSGNEDTPALAYGNGVWFAAGVNRDTANADIDLVSTDGAHWTVLPTPSVDDRRAAIFFKDTFITVGANRSIRQSAVFTPTAVGYTTWRDGYFPDHDARSTFSADGESDGLGNLLEYTLGRSPLSPAGADGVPALPQVVVVATNPLLSDRIALQFSLPEPAAADLTLVVEATAGLGGSWAPLATKIGARAWVWNAGGSSRVVLGTPTAGRIQVTVGDAQPFTAGPRRFLRLRSFFSQ